MAQEEREYKTVAIFGAAYAGARAANILANGLPEGWRVVVVDRNSHANHVYILPRLAVLPGHEHKAFVPYSRIFRYTDPTTPPSPQHQMIHASLTSLSPHSALLNHPDGSSSTLNFEYCIYALGSKLPDPTNLWAAPIGVHDKSEYQEAYKGTKKESVEWLKTSQQSVKDAKSVLVVGGGALGIQFASDIAAIYPQCAVTLLHSRKMLLPRFDSAMSDEILSSLTSLNVRVLLGERLDLSCKESTNDKGQVVLRTESGREVAAEMVLMCTGQSPNTSILASMDARTVDSNGHCLARVLRTMQLGVYADDDDSSDSSTSSDRAESPQAIYSSLSGATTAVASLVDLSSKLADLEVKEHVSESKSEPEVSYTTSLEPAERAAVEHVSDVLNDELDVECDVRNVLDDVPVPIQTVSENSHSDSEEIHNELQEEEEDIYAGVPKTTPYPHMFVAGDAADAFGSIKAGHVAYFQAEVAAKNIIRLISREEKPDEEEEFEQLEEYTPCPPAIKVSLGLTKSIYEINGVVGTNEDGVPDLNAAGIWGYFGYPEVGKEGGEDGMFA